MLKRWKTEREETDASWEDSHDAEKGGQDAAHSEIETLVKEQKRLEKVLAASEEKNSWT